MDRRAFVLVLGGTWLSARAGLAHAGACAGGLVESLATPNGARIGRGGGLVTWMTPDIGSARSGAASRQLTLMRDTTVVPVREERIAPGLVRFVPTVHEVGTHTVQSSFGAIACALVDEVAPTPPACDVTRVKLERTRAEVRGRMLPHYRLVATHRRAPAEGIQYLIARDARTQTPLLSARVSIQSRTTVLFETPDACEALIPGSEMPVPGQGITLAFVSAQGVVGASTERVVVR